MKRKFFSLSFLNILVLIIATRAKRISEKKCEEYMDPVVTETCLGFGDGSSNCITTANCPIVGTSLIIGGIQAKPAEFPHMAAIGWYANGGIIFKCGGSLISEKFVLTAAHCLASHSKPDVVRLGDLNLDPDVNDNAEPIDIKIKSTKIHKDYRSDEKKNDIALIELDKSINITETFHIRPACLAQNYPAGGSSAIVSGWGVSRLNRPNKKSDHLLWAVMSIVNKYACLAQLKKQSILKSLDEGQVCATGTKSDKIKRKDAVTDACQGDSGGPLQVRDSQIECVYRIFGVISFGQACGTTTPSLYTSVSFFLDWIEENVWPEEK